MKKPQVDGRIEYIKEATLLLITIGSGETYSFRRKEYERKHQKPAASVIEKYKFLEGISDELCKLLKGREDDMKFYFGRKYKEGRSFGQLLLLSDEWREGFNSVEDVKNYWAGLSQKDYYKFFASQICLYQTVIYDYDMEDVDIDDGIEIIKLINSLNISNDEKWSLQELFLYPEKYRGKLLELLELAISVIEKHSKEIEAYGKAFAEYWDKVFSEVEVEDYLGENLGIKVDKMEGAPNQVYPNYFIPHSVNVIAYGNEETRQLEGPYYVRLGFLFGDDYTLEINDPNDKYDEKAVNALKLLGDKSKFEILSKLKGQKRYGGELARELNLTAATISHHMSALINAGLVEVVKEDNRMYYSSNTKEVERLFEFCKDKLV